MMMSATEKLAQSGRELEAAEQQLRCSDAEEAKHATSSTAYDAWRRRRDDDRSEVARLRLLVEQLQQAVQVEAIEAWRAAKALQGRKNVTLAKRMREEGPELLRAMLDWVTEIAAAEAETVRLNSNVPDGETGLNGPDALARTVIALPETINREVDTELWVIASNGEIVPDQRAVVAVSKDEGHFGKWRTHCARRRFKEVSYLPAVDVQRATTWLKALRLPFFDGPGFAWNGETVDYPAQLLRMLDRLAPTAPQQPARQKQTRFVAVAPWTPPEPSRRQKPVGERTVTD
jgi:hypothetical protein